MAIKAKIAFDVDGVLTESVYIPKEDRSCARYQALKPNKKMIEAAFKFADLGFEVGVLSTRNCKYPVKCFMDWWDRVESRPHPFTCIRFRIPKLQKAYFAEQLGYDVLIDDSMEEITVCNKTIVKGFLLFTGRYTASEFDSFKSRNPDIEWTCSDTAFSNILYYLREAGIYV